MKKERGFTLIELIVTIVIVAVLSTIAIPSYRHLIEKVRIQFAKTTLSNLYAAERSFNAQHQSYSSRLDAIGFNIDGVTYFDIGFDIDFPPPPRAFQGNATCLTLCGSTLCSYDKNWECEYTANFGLDLDVIGFATRTSFLAEAHAHMTGHFGIGPSTKPITLTINENKQIIFVEPAN